MRLVILESPYAGKNIFQRWANIRYARRCVRDCLKRDESPIASHLLFTQRGILKDTIPDDRVLGIKAGHAWLSKADAVVVYIDRGVSVGMHHGVAKAKKAGVPIEYRRLDIPPEPGYLGDNIHGGMVT